MLDARAHSIVLRRDLLGKVGHWLRLGTIHVRMHGTWRWLHRRCRVGKLHMLCFELARALTMIWLHRRVSRCVVGCLTLRYALRTLEVWRELVLVGMRPIAHDNM
jgi:hypothetical protein